jgi:hypothetical protein
MILNSFYIKKMLAMFFFLWDGFNKAKKGFI